MRKTIKQLIEGRFEDYQNGTWTEAHIYKFCQRHNTTRKYISFVFTEMITLQRVGHQIDLVSQRREFETCISDWEYNIEHDIRNVDVDSLYYGYEADLVIIQKLR